MDRDMLKELLFQALETEKGGVQVYETALRCAVNEDLKEEWSKYLDQTKRHVEIIINVLGTFQFATDQKTPGAEIIEMKGSSLVNAMEKALAGGDAKAAQLVAAECVVDAETKDHLDWELLGEAAKELEGEEAVILKEAVEQVEEEEDEHLYHSMGWARELWLEALGLPAVLPPPEEKKEVKTAIGAAKAKQQRGRMIHRRRPVGSKRTVKAR